MAASSPYCGRLLRCHCPGSTKPLGYRGINRVRGVGLCHGRSRGVGMLERPDRPQRPPLPPGRAFGVWQFRFCCPWYEQPQQLSLARLRGHIQQCPGPALNLSVLSLPSALSTLVRFLPKSLLYTSV